MKIKKFRYEMEIISPTVVTSGNNINGFELIYDRRNDKVYVMNIMKLIKNSRRYIDAFFTFDYNSRDFRLENKLKEIGINNYLNYVKYELSLNGTSFKPNSIKEITKTSGKPYIPGSTIKGAIRSSLTRVLNRENDYKISLDETARRSNEIRNPEKQADNKAEERIFGSPNNSPFRLLRISDTETKDYSDLELYDVKVMNICNNRVKWYTRSGNVDNIEGATSIYVEAFKEGTILKGQLSQGFFETFKNINIAKREIESIDTVEGIVNKIRNDIDLYIDKEIEFYSNYHVDELVSFYRKLKSMQQQLRPNEFIIQIGFSTGYLPKTVVRNIDSRFIIKLQQIYRGRIYNDLFPKTRKIIIKNGKIYKPLGWVKIRLIES
ncbi:MULTISPECIES: type III-A CRISPR-associated RAMP protein Csm5 [Caloramator]|uniref:CRISPR system Cms protein Csm5 n=1 Tax=Caloramator australicus RC3 TaxID=857293 RepID=I7KAH5_9CLOT|nr:MULTISPECIES: type III-A CRISPR-associated RAMP protein Csm5 [Caloramator]MDO6354572.1 type III-A CRISPR-associated RAMP protein Csm5 [Caloramator sp. CAR-1]CCJ34762.1 CRISPR-associated protein, Csm5 family [Caloramator australicus RC3]